MTQDKPLPEAKAREILARAAEIDRQNADSVSVETLRAAAYEAGISPSSFEAALQEHSSLEVARPGPVSRRQVVARALAGAGIGMLALLATALIVRGAAQAPVAPPPDTPIRRR